MKRSRQEGEGGVGPQTSKAEAEMALRQEIDAVWRARQPEERSGITTRARVLFLPAIPGQEGDANALPEEFKHHLSFRPDSYSNEAFPGRTNAFLAGTENYEKSWLVKEVLVNKNIALSGVDPSLVAQVKPPRPKQAYIDDYEGGKELEVDDEGIPIRKKRGPGRPKGSGAGFRRGSMNSAAMGSIGESESISGARRSARPRKQKNDDIFVATDSSSGGSYPPVTTAEATAEEASLIGDSSLTSSSLLGVADGGSANAAAPAPTAVGVTEDSSAWLGPPAEPTTYLDQAATQEAFEKVRHSITDPKQFPLLQGYRAVYAFSGTPEQVAAAQSSLDQINSYRMAAPPAYELAVQKAKEQAGGGGATLSLEKDAQLLYDNFIHPLVQARNEEASFLVTRGVSPSQFPGPFSNHDKALQELRGLVWQVIRSNQKKVEGAAKAAAQAVAEAMGQLPPSLPLWS
jgi:hypothetical protein